MQLDLLWQYMQVDMDAERFEQEMRNSPNRQQLIKQRNFLRDQQANMARIEDDVAGMLDRLEAVRDETTRLQDLLDAAKEALENDPPQTAEAAVPYIAISPPVNATVPVFSQPSALPRELTASKFSYTG